MTRRADGTLAVDFAGVDELYDRILGARRPSGGGAGVHAGGPGGRPRRDGVHLPRHHLPARGLVRVARPGPRPGRATWSSGTASTRWRPGASRCGTNPTWSSSGPERKDDYLRLYAESARALKSVDARLAVGGPVDRGRGMGGVPRRVCPRARPAVGLRLLAHVRQPAAGHPPGSGAARLRRRARLVDRMGCRVDPLRLDPRQRHRRAVHPVRLRLSAGTPASVWPTGWSATTSKSSVARPGCSTTASDC